MKNKFFMLGLPAMVLAFGLVLGGCYSVPTTSDADGFVTIGSKPIKGLKEGYNVCKAKLYVPGVGSPAFGLGTTQIDRYAVVFVNNNEVKTIKGVALAKRVDLGSGKTSSSVETTDTKSVIVQEVYVTVKSLKEALDEAQVFAL